MTQVVPSNNSTLKVTIQSQSGDQEKNTEMTAHDGNSNRLLWTTKLGSRADVTSFTVQGDVISVSTDHGETLTFDARTGRQLQDNSEKPQDQSNDQPVDSRPKRETKKRPPKGDKK